MASQKRIEKVGVVGGGNMGSGIAQKIATEGWPVVLVDTEAGIERAKKLLETSITEGVERRIYSPDSAQALRDRIECTTDTARLAGCDLVIEAIFENKEAKSDLFARLSEVCPTDTIFSTNTSSFPVASLAQAATHPDRVVGLHFFYHPAKNRLVEVIPGKDTSDETVDRVWRFIEAVGKTPIHCLDRPGFVVNRYFVPWLNEACRMLEEGMDIASIEAGAKKGLGTAFGPFDLMNMTGIPIALHAQTTLFEELGPMYRPSQRLAEQVAAGTDWVIEGDIDAEQVALAEKRSTAVVFLVALQVLDEQIGTPEDIDIGARVGLRWPLGPFERMNQIGIAPVRERVQEYTSLHDVPTPQVLLNQGDTPFVLQQVHSNKEEGVATITINRPDALNALSPSLVAELERLFDAAAADPAVDGIVIRGAGKAFVAGADLKFFKDNLDRNNVHEIVDFTARGQALFQRIDDCSKRVVMLLDGLSLGGGSELALCGDIIIATDRGTLGFPETGLGIYPGLGGTQRAARRCGIPLAQWLVLSGQVIDAKTAESLGLVDQVVSREDADDSAKRAALHGLEHTPLNESPLRTWAETWFAAERLEQWLDGSLSTHDDAKIAKLAKKIGFKAPVASRIATELVAFSQNHSISEGVAEELRRLPEVFQTQDAAEGINSVLERRRPSFQGA